MYYSNFLYYAGCSSNFPFDSQDCERTTITAAARRVVVSNSFDVTTYLFTPSPPLLVGDNKGCQFAPYNTYYEGLREDLLATGLAAALRSTISGDTPASPTRGGEGGGICPTAAQPALQCASNKWKGPVGKYTYLSSLLFMLQCVPTQH